ncbi:hypothetical protein S7711_02162 [Stachybotrys chartarum IBT 7711]|uniref:Transcription factor n=1 Tax=Stachybotrys chartarum (strain CBS 109288 / IBT 7711) TaxID=1280523 RepID=A0A084ARM6_STACB|nr:hypothetical protein S7711_02162 [Stachybotrys chartarum IBT 7711]KFA48059.1 hypothetical protein S40293_02684 [Stachybotrys chartarum IBT 40293]
MSGPDMAAAQGSGSNASEFVRKLFRMLEDPTHQDVARWGNNGDTFVVVEGEKFTRSILPKHFKHSNMSSFIRQLNKYDFHKVKPSTDTETSSPNGNVLEFKHPYFRVDSKDDLDNIRRKAPAPRKQQATDDYTATQHMNIISEQLTATQQQVQQLQEVYADVLQTNKLLVNEVLILQKMLNAQKQAQFEMINFLTPVAENRNGALMGQMMSSGGSGSAGDITPTVPELRRARELLSSVATNVTADQELERLHGVYGSPTDSGAIVTPTSMPLMNDPMTDITRYPIYPVGQTVGIDPFHSDHIHKIPYAMPSDLTVTNLAEQQQQQHQQPQAPPPIALAKPPAPLDKPTELWGAKKPLVFLVEDDNTCSKIGIKFLRTMGCEVEHASNGADAYQRVADASRERFDMIFMDIIMPKLDGVSATLYIRQHCPSVPIIAMTSNIRPEEVNGYFEHGMNGVLAKPFTKDGMLKSVTSHMAHLLKNPPSQGDGSSNFMMSGMPFLSAPAHHIKFETPTPPGPWSPGNMPHTSPLNSNADHNFSLLNGQYSMAPAQRQNYTTTVESSTSGRLSDHDSPPDSKRQRLNASHVNF